jgi:hypothetical protein
LFGDSQRKRDLLVAEIHVVAQNQYEAFVVTDAGQGSSKVKPRFLVRVMALRALGFG